MKTAPIRTSAYCHCGASCEFRLVRSGFAHDAGPNGEPIALYTCHERCSTYPQNFWARLFPTYSGHIYWTHTVSKNVEIPVEAELADWVDAMLKGRIRPENVWVDGAPIGLEKWKRTEF